MLKKTLKRNKGITLIALVVTIIVLLILAGISISLLAGQNGILSRATEAKEKDGKAQVKEIARLAYAELLTENLETVSDDTILSAVIGKLEQGDSTKIRVNLKMTDGETKVYVKLNRKYYEITANSNNIDIGEEGISSIEGEKYTIQLEPTTSVAKMYIGGTEVKTSQTILSGAEITITEGTEISSESFKIKVLEKNVETTGTVTVVQKPIHAESITISAKGGATSVNINETLQLKATTVPEQITDKIEWSSSNKSIATVDNTGLVTGVAEGSVTITVKTKDSDGNETKNSVYNIEVKKVEVKEECYACHGTGIDPQCQGAGTLPTVCTGCNGTRILYGETCQGCLGTGYQNPTCTGCNGTGKCPVCNGTGEI